ncbi:hypothetical protein [Streptomyces sp. H27-C3]|uniref:hypothetical protein n=1 Tax=Streptomyces sp. H27-C3 TaxID=3046305 RepID=UPI0024BAEEED|nr:hypothetical protein [Streptomyces sp. H27-C3]MDJ0463152.1 hypothetical protein [Streptomyces sp. H27-C3]
MTNTWQPRRLEKKPSRQHSTTDDALNPMQAIQSTLWDAPESAPQPKKRQKPVEEWKANDLINHWSAQVARARWTDHLIGHTNRAALGKLFREALGKDHTPAALKSTIDAFFANDRYHNANRPWALYQSVINDLLAKAAPTPKADPWAQAQQTEVPKDITENWGGYPTEPHDPWAPAVKR